MKTPAARRTIPIHPVLLEVGFLDYVDDVKKIADGRKIFPYLNYSELDGYSATPSERWGKFLDKLGIKDVQKVFHSFRSTVNNCLKENMIPEETRCQFVGHEYDSVNSVTYSKPHSIEYLHKNVVSCLQYPHINFESLKFEKGQFDAMLSVLSQSKARLWRCPVRS